MHICMNIYMHMYEVTKCDRNKLIYRLYSQFTTNSIKHFVSLRMHVFGVVLRFIFLFLSAYA